MQPDLMALLRDPEIADDVKVVLVPELLKAQHAESRTPGASWRKALQSGPAIAAIASILTVGISEAVKVYLKKEEGVLTLWLTELQQQHQQWQESTKRDFDARTQALNKEHERSLERLKFQFEVIRTALADSKSPKDRADALLFFTEIRLLDGLDDVALRKWGLSEAIPGIAAAQAAPPTESASVRMTGADYKRKFGADVYGPDTSDQEPSNNDLMRVLGCPGAPGGFTPPLVKVTLPFELQAFWNTNQTLSSITVHEAIAPHVERAFRAISEMGAQEHARLFGGTYNPRKTRGGTRWSNHAWGVEIDIDPEGNELKWGDDRFTMHPDVVRAFKDAGFAWRGDLNFDAMSFVISKRELEKIAASGYQPAAGPDGCETE